MDKPNIDRRNAAHNNNQFTHRGSKKFYKTVERIRDIYHKANIVCLNIKVKKKVLPKEPKLKSKIIRRNKFYM
jgi:hypothetical protein